LQFPDFQIEQTFWDKNILVAGIDEAGRGCLAGPVVAASVIFPKNFENSEINIINDSKKLSKKNREVAFEFIISNAISYSFSIIDSSIIDNINILNASQLAMNLSIRTLQQDENFHCLIDGNYFLNMEGIEFSTIVKGDSKSISIAAASIIAKVIRDRFVTDYLNILHPNFHFDEHLGYATKKHYSALDRFGKTSFHRNTFLKKYFEQKKISTNNPKIFDIY